MLRLLGLSCVLALLGGLGCGDDDAAADAGPGGAAGSGGASHLNSGTGGAVANASGGTGHVGSGGGGQGSGGQGGGGATSGSGGTGSGSGGAGIDVDSPTARTAACIEYVRGFCEGQVHCGGGAAGSSLDQAITQCIWSSAFTCPDLIFAEGSTRTVEGTIACAQAWRDQPCSDHQLGLAPDCASSGTLAANAKCISGFQCASRRCDARGDSCATCYALVAEGATCAAMQACPDEDVCTGGICVRAEAVDAGTPIVAPELKLGDVCDRNTSGCGVSNKYDCWPDADGVGHCIAYPRLGEDCEMQKWCQFGESYCDISSKCLAFPTDGQPCGKDRWTGVESWCAEDLLCDATATPPVCRQKAGPGETCAGSCRGDALCMLDPPDMNTTKCLRPRFAGESCTDAGDRCLPGAMRCEGGVCVLVETQGLYESLCKP